MSLTYGTGPFGTAPAGRLAGLAPTAERVLYLEPVPYRVRALVDGVVVLDSDAAAMLHETGHLPVFYVPAQDVRAELLAPSATRTTCPWKGEASYHHLDVGGRRRTDAVWRYADPIASAVFLAPLVALRFDAADRWLAEDAEVLGHPRDPYHRVDVLPTSRRVVVSLDGAVLAGSTRALLVCEAALPRRLYLPAQDVDDARLLPSATRTTCAYKGVARYRSAQVGGVVVPDVAWCYPDPAPELDAIRDRWCFFDERVDVDLDGVRAERPVSAWSVR